MKLTSYVLLISTVLVATSCSEKKSPGGVKYKVHRKGDGKEVAFGQFLVMNMELKDSKDSVWFSSKEMGSPVIIPKPDASMEKDDGEYGVFKILTKGDSVSFQLPAETMFTKTRKRPVPANVDPKSLFSFNVGIRDTWTKEQVDAFQQKMMAENQLKQQKMADSLQREQQKMTDIIRVQEMEALNTYLKQKRIVAQGSPSGIRYVVKKKGTGKFAAAGQTALVHYAGYSLNGKLFDTSIASVAKENNFDNQGSNEPYPVVVSTGNVIQGWHLMLALMNKGMQVTVYIPSSLGYGQQGNGPAIPPNTILVFDMELVDIK